VYGNIQREGNTVSYTADSPQGDLAGTLSMRFAAETTGKQIVRSLYQHRKPLYNSETGKYEGEVTCSITLIRPASAAVAVSEEALETVCEAAMQTDVKAAIARARH
jgi:hypothetical protein